MRIRAWWGAVTLLVAVGLVGCGDSPTAPEDEDCEKAWVIRWVDGEITDSWECIPLS